MDSFSSRPESPSNAGLNTSIGLKSSRKRALKGEALRQNEKMIRDEENDQTSDFIEYLELLVDFFK